MKFQAILVILLSGTILSCSIPGKDSIDIPYPDPFPDSTALTFLPGIVSNDGRDFGSCFSADGNTFYFARTVGKTSGIFSVSYDGQRWREAQPLLTDSTYSNADPTFGIDGKLYFISNRPKDSGDILKDYDIWYTAALPTGDWLEPINFSTVNSDSNEFYVSFSRNGNLYFASSRAGGFGEEDIYVGRLENGLYATPENLGSAINTLRSEYDPGISGDDDALVFASSGREDSFGAADLYQSTRDGDQWQPSVHLMAPFSTPTRDFCPYFSRDGKYFFFSSDGDVKWSAADLLKR